MRFISVFLIMAIVQLAQASEYFEVTDKEVHGASTFKLFLNEEVINRTLSFCSNIDNSIEYSSKKAKNSWHERNDIYLPLGPIFKEEIKETALKEGAEETWKEFESSTFPKTIEITSNHMIEIIKLQPSKEASIKTCQILIDSVELGKMDYNNADPKIRDYMNMRLDTYLKYKLPTK